MLRMVGSLILTRIFAPETFGILAIIGAVTSVIGMLTDIGLRQAIIQSPNGGDSYIPQYGLDAPDRARSADMGTQLALCARLVFCRRGGTSPVSVRSTGKKSLPLFMVVSSFSAVILGFQSMKAITANRELNLKRVTSIEILSQLVGLVFVISVGLGYPVDMGLHW